MLRSISRSDPGLVWTSENGSLRKVKGRSPITTRDAPSSSITRIASSI